MRVRSLTLENYRGFEKLELNLDRDVTVLVGVNGAGKTSVLEAVAMVISRIAAFLTDGPEPTVVDLHHTPGMAALSLTYRGSGFGNDSTQRLEFGVDAATNAFVRPHSPTSNSPVEPRQELSLFFATDRGSRTGSWRDSPAENWLGKNDVHLAAVGALNASADFRKFSAWFYEQENVENERFRRASISFDRLLKSVRFAVASMLRDGSYGELLFRREIDSLVLAKEDGEVRLDRLSHGERSLLAIAGDVARRLAIANPASENPLNEPALLMIDEIDLHLHPAWQREVIPRLRETFPNCQLIVTTHSPQVIASVHRDSVVVLDGFSAHGVYEETYGHDTNDLLREVFGLSDRPARIAKMIERVDLLLANDDVAGAREALADFIGAVGPNDPKVAFFEGYLAGLADEAHPQGE
jgi:predicted ATPase